MLNGTATKFSILCTYILKIVDLPDFPEAKSGGGTDRVHIKFSTRGRAPCPDNTSICAVAPDPAAAPAAFGPAPGPAPGAAPRSTARGRVPARGLGPRQGRCAVRPCDGRSLRRAFLSGQPYRTTISEIW
eukprot:SAG31_NODE_13058_length_896_cov_0.809285_2_plen_129_part_01